MVHDYIPHHHGLHPEKNHCSEHCGHATFALSDNYLDHPPCEDPDPHQNKDCCKLVNIPVIISESISYAGKPFKTKADHLCFNHSFCMPDRHNYSLFSQLAHPEVFLKDPPLLPKHDKYIYFGDPSPPLFKSIVFS